MKNKSIGVFDSGLGGLTVLNKLIEELPNEDMIYLGDTARVPYGTRDENTVKKFSIEITEFLMKKNVKALVVACNTITSLALEEIEKTSGLPVINVIEPGSLAAVNKTINNKIGIIATDGTIRSRSYNMMLNKMEDKIISKGIGCPKFVEIIESGYINKDEVIEVAKDYIRKFNGFEMDTLILGCTHFPIIQDQIKDALNSLGHKNVILIDPALETARRTKKELRDRNILNNSNKKGEIQYYVTKDAETFKETGNNILKSSIESIEEVKLS